MTPFLKPDHVKDGLALLLEQFKGKPRFEALLTSFLEEVQEFEDATWSVITKRILDNATDEQLVVLGKLVGQEKIGDTDDEFRLYITARIAVNVSDGQGDDIQTVADLLLGSLPWEYIELYPSTVIIDVSELTANASIIADLLREARGGGVAFSLHFSEEPESETFGFASGDDEEDDVVRGFGGDDPDEGPGGLLIGTY